MEVSRLSKCRTNHNIGVRINYLRCAVSACPYHCRLLENIAHGDDIPHYELEIAPGLDHNHQVEVARERGLSLAQKTIIQLCIERGQSAPKKVRISNITTFKATFFKIKVLRTKNKILITQVIREFTRLQHLATVADEVVIPTPSKSMISSFASYQRLRQRGGVAVGGQSLQHIFDFAENVALTPETREDDPY